MTNKTVIPTRGAVVRADYVANVGMRVLMTLNHSSGQPVPFGAIATVKEQEGNSFIVGDKGQVYLTGLNSSGTLIVKWGNGDSEHCKVNFSLPKSAINQQVPIITGICI